MKTMPLVALLLALGCKPTPRAATAARTESVAMDPEVHHAILALAGGDATGISMSRRLASSELPPELAYHYEIHLEGLAPAGCLRLKTYFGRREVDCGSPGTRLLSDFLPTMLQTLGGASWERPTERWDSLRVEFVMTAPAAAYEAARLFGAGAATGFSVFFAPHAALEEIFNDPRHFSLAGEAPLADAWFLFKSEARPGDVLSVYEEELAHAAVVVAPGMLFEKVGSADRPVFRMAPLSELKKSWSGANKMVLRRPVSGTAPAPLERFVTRRTSKGGVFEDAGRVFGTFVLKRAHSKEGKSDGPSSLVWD